LLLKIATEAAGQTWSLETSKANSYKAPLSSMGNSSSSALSDQSRNNNKSSSNSYYDDPISSSSYQSGAGLAYNDQIKSQTNDFFSRKQAENEQRPADLPPNQGGKYAGFGNTVDTPQQDSNEFFGTLTSVRIISLYIFKLMKT
jgi:ADP-ribosylation factor GTPase-activating protein 1